MLEQKMLPAPLSLRKPQRFYELWPGAEDKDQIFVVYYTSQIHKWICKSCINL